MLFSNVLFIGFASSVAARSNTSFAKLPFVPPPQSTGGRGNWSEAYTKAKAVVAKLHNREKANITHGYQIANGCAGNSGGIASINFPGYCFHDSQAGLSGTDFVNAYPPGVHMAATFNRALMSDVAYHIGLEFKKKGVHVALAPIIGPVGRVTLGGRAWESYGPDPYLNGEMSAISVTQIQKSVISAVKHFIANEQETGRRTTPLGIANSANIDDRTMHELYMWAFMDAVRAGTGIVLCAYGRTNFTYTCENSKLLNGYLKGELGFQGVVLTDWDAQVSPPAAMSGLDMFMPFPGPFEDLEGNVTTKGLTQERLDDMATRILAIYYKVGIDKDFPPTAIGMPFDFDVPRKTVDARTKASRPGRFQSAVEGHVLVKNIHNALPLKAPKLLSLYGYNAPLAPKMIHEPIEGVPLFSQWLLGLQGIDLTDQEMIALAMSGNGSFPNAARRGHLSYGGGSSAGAPSYQSTPADAMQQQAYEDDTQLYWDFVSQDPSVNGASDACLVFINEFATEGLDRSSLADTWSDKLVLNVARKCKNTIVIINNTGIRLVDGFVDHPNVTALIFAHLPGQDSGKALIEVLYGKQSPSGRLPYTVAKKEADYGRMLKPEPLSANASTDYTEGVYIDYRHFMAKNITPRYEFGFGLTYTTFKYSNLNVVKLSNATVWPPKQAIQDGGNPALWTPLLNVDAKIQNTGNAPSAEVAQLYVGIPGDDVPARQLRGFAKPFIKPGQTETVHFSVTRRDLSVWNTEKQDWELRRGRYKIYIGASVLDIKLEGEFQAS